MTTPPNLPIARLCPFCSTPMDAVANMCSACGRFSTVTTSKADKLPLLHQVRAALVARGTGQAKIEQLFSNLDVWLSGVPSGATTTTAIISLTLGIWVVTTFGWHGQRGGLALIVLGIAILLRRKLVKSIPRSTPALEESDTAIRWLGFDTNLAVLQLLTLGTAAVYAYRWENTQASAWALCTVTLAFVLRRTNGKVAAFACGLIAATYLLILWIVSTFAAGLAYRIQVSRGIDNLYESIVPWGSLALALGFLAVFPQIQHLRVGKFRIGSLKGDFDIVLFGSLIPVSVSSSTLLVVAIYSANETISLTRWVAL